MRMVERKIVIVTRPTRFAGMVSQHATAGQAEFKMVRARLAAPRQASGGAKSQAVADKAIEVEAEADFQSLKNEDTSYTKIVFRLRNELADLSPVHVLDRQYLPTYVFGPDDIVLTVGQDGLVANTAKYALGRPIIAINPDPEHIDGILLPYRADEARGAVNNVMRNAATFRRVTLAEAIMLDGQRLLAFNDLFIGARSHVSARYRVEVGGKEEQQSSSGLLVSTGAGSTGWLSSVMNMPSAVARLTAATPAGPPASPPRLELGWEDRRLVFVTREPFRSKTSGIDLTSGVLAPDDELVIESNMSQGGCIFSDGIEADFIEFNSGAIARIHAAKDQALLVSKSA